MTDMSIETKLVDKEEVIKLLESGKTEKEVAAKLGCSEPMIYQIKREFFKKLIETKPNSISKLPASRPYQKSVPELVPPEPASKQKPTQPTEPESEAVWKQRRTEQLKTWIESCVRFGRAIDIELVEEYNRQCALSKKKTK